MNTVIRINLSNKSAKSEEMPAEYDLLGGRALTSTVVSQEVPPECEALGERNKLIIAPGLLGGLAASSVNRLSIGGKSPLTNGIKESNSGGQVAWKLARLGIKAIIIEGKAAQGELLALKVSKSGPQILEAKGLQGVKISESAALIKERHGENVGIILIGPAGERRLLASAIAVTDKEGVPSRFAARGGLGAVMGSKGLKAIIVDDNATKPVKAKDRPAFKEAVERYTKALQENPVISKVYKPFGTTAMVDYCNELGGMPTRNFSTGRFEDAKKVNGTALRERILERDGDPSHACVTGCIIKSSNIYNDKNGKPIVRSFEYETIVLCGTNLGISELDDIAEINRFCNELGLDTIDIGASLGIAMDAGLTPFGDAEGAKKLLKEIEDNTVMGRVLGNGAALAGEVLGVDRIPAVKGQAMPGYDPRAIKGHGVTYASSPMGADHTAGMNIREGLDQSSPAGQAQSSREMQLLATVYDSLGACFFVNPAVRNNPELLLDLVNARYGVSLVLDDLWEMARKTLRTEVQFNRASGLTSAQDQLPEIFLTETLPSSGTVFDVQQTEIDAITEW